MVPSAVVIQWWLSSPCSHTVNWVPSGWLSVMGSRKARDDHAGSVVSNMVVRIISVLFIVMTG